MHHLVAAAHGLELTPIYSIVHDCCQPNWAGRTDKNSDLQVVTAVRFFPIVEPVNELLETGERERAELTRLRDQAITADMRAWSVTERKPQSLPDDLSWHDNLAGQIGLDRQFQLRDPESKSRLTKNGVQTTFDYDLETLRGVARLHARRGAKFQIVNLGGLRIRSGDALVEWIEERRAAGITGFHTSLAGYGEIHDRWNGRAGDFDYQTSILRLAGERRMVVCRACSIARR